MGMPSGRTIATGYDSSGRPISVKGTLGANSTHYVSSVSYAPQGAPSSISLANGAMTQQTCFNSLLQPVVLRLRTGQASCGAADGNDIGYFGYTFSATQNNGNVLGQAIQYGAGQSYASKSFQQTYSYTANRLMGVTETYSDAFTQGSSFTQSYQYDVVGKRWVSAGLVTDPFTPQGNVYDGNNHMSSATYGDGRGLSCDRPTMLTFVLRAHRPAKLEVTLDQTLNFCTRRGRPRTALSAAADKGASGSHTAIWRPISN